MVRRKQSGLDLIAALPWPIGIVLGIAAYWIIRYGLGIYFGHSNSQLIKAVGENAQNGAFAPLAWMALILCWIAALASFGRQRKRMRLLEAQTGLDSLRSIDWREFQMLVGEAFRRQGYRMEETGIGGSDGGIDLILTRDGRTTLVQCKQWRSRQVNVSTVREMWGLAAHHRADEMKIVCAHEFTADALRFADGKPIELISGQRLVDLIRSRQTSTPAPNARIEPNIFVAPNCPRCQTMMVKRHKRSSGELFWGCPRFPQCKGTRNP